MLIVSKDRKRIVNMDLIESITILETNEVICNGVCFEANNEAYYILSSYLSGSDAKAALRNIWSAYNSGTKVFIMP